MRNSYTMRTLRQLIIFCLAVCAFAVLPLLTSARPSTSVNIVNNSARSIQNVYLSPANVDNWGDNQLGAATISPGQSFTLSNIACDQQQIKVIGEDQDGCFLSIIVNCGENATWTITNDTPANCGS